MSSAPLLAARPIYLTREGSVFRLAFAFNRAILERAQKLPYASFDPETKTWTAQVCAQSVDALRRFYYDGLTDVAVDDLLSAGEEPEPCRPAMLRPGSLKRPYQVKTAFRDDNLYARLNSVPGAQWDKEAKALSYPPTAAAALAELVERGVIDDPGRLLSPADVVVYFDNRTGAFVVRGDQRAAAAFGKYFPAQDVVARWAERGLDVAFADSISEEIYRGERARGAGVLQPEGLVYPLYDYQASTTAIAVERTGLCLVLEMGLGKTILGIAVGHEVVVNRGDAPRTVCVVPAAVRTQWEQEIRKFTGATDVVVVKGDKKKRLAAYETAAEARWVVLPFSETLSRDYKLIAPLVNGAVLIADEAHRLRNHQTKRTQVMRQLGARASRRYALTGTPVDSTPGDLYGIVNWTMPGLLGTYMDFMGRYSFAQHFGDRFAGFHGARNLDELAVRAKPLYVRHTMAEVAPHLPPLRVAAKALDPDTAYTAALRRAHKEAANELKEAAVGRVAHTKGVLSGEEQEEAVAGAEMTATMLLRLLTSSPRLVTGSDAPSAKALVDAGMIPDIDGPKLDELRVQAAEIQAAGQRVVIFTFSKRMAHLIAERFSEDGIRHVLFTGGMASGARDASVAAFNAGPVDDNPGPTAFIATDAGGEGLNLGPNAEGGGAAILINFDLPWTPGILAQRSARIRRINSVTDNGFLVLNYWLTGTLEHGILKLLEQRSDLQSAIFGERTGQAPTGRGQWPKSIFEEAMAAWRKGGVAGEPSSGSDTATADTARVDGSADEDGGIEGAEDDEAPGELTDAEIEAYEALLDAQTAGGVPGCDRSSGDNAAETHIEDSVDDVSLPRRRGGNAVANRPAGRSRARNRKAADTASGNTVALHLPGFSDADFADGRLPL